MAFYQFEKKQFIPAGLETVWDFISTPKNLQEITPDYMGFDIRSKNLPEKMYPGMIISYTVKPLFGLKMLWVTEITQVREQQFFIDEQRVGPYAMWHHQHHIEAVAGGVLMTDIISYRPPFGIIGALANTLFIRRQLTEIFEFRKKALEQRFGPVV